MTNSKINTISKESELEFLYNFYKENLKFVAYSGYVDPNLRLIRTKGTPNLVTKDGYPVIARYGGLCKVLTETTLNEFMEEHCTPFRTISTDEYRYLLNMNLNLKNEYHKFQNSIGAPHCFKCGKSFTILGYHQHIEKFPECKIESKNAIHPASEFYGVKMAAYKEYRKLFPVITEVEIKGEEQLEFII